MGAELNEVKAILAFEATKLCRGEAAAQASAEAARTFAGGGNDNAGLPTTDVPEAEFATGINIADLLLRAGLAASKGEPRQLIRGGGARLNDAQVADEALVATPPSWLTTSSHPLSAGRKRHVRVRVV